MALKQAVVHIGLHKTGTTAVQDFLATNIDRLADRGAHYVPLEIMRREVAPLLYKTDLRKQMALEAFVAETLQSTLILSDENIAGGTDDILAGQFYPDAGPKVRALLEALGGVRVHLVVALRNPAELLPALYSEHIRRREFISFAEYVSQLDIAGLSYWDAFAWLRALGANISIHIIPFEAQHGGGVPLVASRILQLAIERSTGLDLSAFYENKVRTSFTSEEIDLAAAIAAHSSAKVAQLFLNNIEAESARFGSHRFQPIGAQTTAALAHRYEYEISKWREFSSRFERSASASSSDPG